VNKLFIILDEFNSYISYTRNLGFEEDPNYDYLRGLFKKIMETYVFPFDYQFDWTKSGDNRLRKNSSNNVNVRKKDITIEIHNDNRE